MPDDSQPPGVDPGAISDPLLKGVVVDDYVRAFTLGRIIDGDTITAATVDLGYHVRITNIEYRLLRINCPESNHAATRAAGLSATSYTTAWLAVHTLCGGLLARTVKTDSFGRYLAEVTCTQGHNLSDALLGSGNAVPFDG
jgi:endonuclease YncB( thermonuclease family)